MTGILSQAQFNIMTCLETRTGKLSQRDLAEMTGLSVGSVNKTITSLREQGYVNEGAITDAGRLVLEPYRVKRAIILAAGFGERLVPITLNTPKPLVRVKGVRIIDTLLDALIDAGIQDIIIVRGYLSEQFDQLSYKYPGLKFVENPIYNEANNISSLMCVRYYLKSAYICEADLLVKNKTLIKKYQYASNYLGVPVERTDDWCFTCHNGYIASFSQGGINCYHAFGISYWDETDGATLAEHVKAVYEQPGGKERLWEMVPLHYYLNHYKVSVRECSFDDITEIDTYNELRAIDSTYI